MVSCEGEEKEGGAVTKRRVIHIQSRLPEYTICGRRIDDGSRKKLLARTPVAEVASCGRCLMIHRRRQHAVQ